MRFGDKKLGKGELPKYISFDAEEASRAYVNGEVRYYASYHTNELVCLYAKGDGAEQYFKKYEGAWYPGTRLIDNTQIFRVMADYTGVNYEYRLKPTGPDGKPLASAVSLAMLVICAGLFITRRRN
jgi:alkaline phosphatase